MSASLRMAPQVRRAKQPGVAGNLPSFGATHGMSWTGSGKTHTMIGGADDGRGVIPRALEKLYARANELQQHHGWTINVKVRSLESKSFQPPPTSCAVIGKRVRCSALLRTYTGP